MKTYLLFCFLAFSVVTFGKEDREIIKQIDNINATALKFYQNDDIVKSFKEFIIAKQLSDSIQDHYGSATANFNLGNIYYLMENYESAKTHYQLTLNALNSLDDNYLRSGTYLNLGKLYRDQNNYAKSIEFLQKALEHAGVENGINTSEKEEIHNIYFESRMSLSEIHIENDNLDEALISILKIGDYLKNHTVNQNLEGYYNYIYGLYYTKTDLFNAANTKFREAITLLKDRPEEMDLEILTNVYMQLSISLAKSGKTEEAYVTLLEHNTYKDKLLNADKTKTDLLTKSKFLLEDYKKNAETANSEKLQQIAVANKFKKINIAIVITLVLLVISILGIYKSYNSKRKLSQTLEVKNSELEMAKNDALKSSELKSKFISNVSHELRTPLYGVVGITSLLLENNNLNNRDKKHLKSLKYSGDYLLNLINDILQVSKMEANKIELKNVSVHLKDLLGDIVNTFDYRLVETNNKINISIDNYVPEYIMCDKIRLSQILINLIGNSVKFTTNGQINLKVVLLSLDPDNVGLSFRIEDNGIGIPKEKFDSIFDNFAQLEDSNVNYQGTGLGLSITKNLIELFKSDIKLESQVGVGTKISFDVDLEIDKTKARAVSQYDSKENKVQKSENKYKILVAEDNKINQIVTKNLLKKQGYVCTIVQNGQEAVDEVKNNHYDLILMDINMPVMNGNDATVAIRKFDKLIPVIALTAADIEEIAQQCERFGYNDIIIKPFDNYEFFQVINQNIQNSKKDRAFQLTKAS